MKYSDAQDVPTAALHPASAEVFASAVRVSNDLQNHAVFRRNMVRAGRRVECSVDGTFGVDTCLAIASNWQD